MQIPLAKRTELDQHTYFQSLQGHISDALLILKAYIESSENILKAFCKRWELDQSRFVKNLFLAVGLHDVGKMTEEFQRNIRSGTSSSRYPHALFALPILNEIPFDLQIEGYPVPVLAVLGHHSQLYRTIYESEQIAERVSYLRSAVLHFVNNVLTQLYKQTGFDRYFELDIKLKDFPNLTRTQIFDNFIKAQVKRSASEPVRTKAVFTYFYALLQLCDDYSSANFRQYIEKQAPKEKLLNGVLTDGLYYITKFDENLESFKKRIFKGFSPYDFQQKLADSKASFAFLFAPCGRGKTEAALWWAWHIKQKRPIDRIIFALPTQVTCNAMYQRLVDDYEFGEKNVGLFHGKSLITLKYRLQDGSWFEFAEDGEEQDYKSYNVLKDEVFKGNVFLKPFTVTTIDHLAYALVHGFSQADFACGNLQNAIIIFDEIHYYERHTLQVLLRIFQMLRQMQIPHLLMTGTAPEFLLKKLKKDYIVITDDKGLGFKPFFLKKETDKLFLNDDSVLQEIRQDILHKKRVFVIVNQVEWAQKIYIRLKEILRDVLPEHYMALYHSRYIHKHRVQKEKHIKTLVLHNPCLLVATQVIEISLDISCDVMYSNIAPPDAIGQRAGRLNRKGRTYHNGHQYQLRLFQVEKHMPYDDKLLQDSWHGFDEGPYSYSDIKEVCDLVYKNINIIKDPTFLRYFKDNVLFGHHHKEVTFGDDEGRALRIREDKFQQIDVVPTAVFNEAITAVEKGKAFWNEFKVKIPLYVLKKEIRMYGNPIHFHQYPSYGVLECNHYYDEEIGILFDKLTQSYQIL